MVCVFCDVLSKKKKGLVFVILGKKDSKLSIFVSFVRRINCTKSNLHKNEKKQNPYSLYKFIRKFVAREIPVINRAG
jgi:hypothetical protein